MLAFPAQLLSMVDYVFVFPSPNVLPSLWTPLPHFRGDWQYD